MRPLLTFSVGSKAFQQNRIFSTEIRDQANAAFILLRQVLQKSDLDLATEDIHRPEDARIVIDFNAQDRQTAPHTSLIRYLITAEPPVVYPRNWSSVTHLQYHKIFTWNDTLIDNRKYFLLRYAHNLGVESDLPDFNHRHFAAMVIGFKGSSNPQELYSSRFDTIRWFLHNHPTEFHLYGAGWPSRFRPPMSSRIERFLSRPINALVGPFYEKNLCYLGPVADKIRTFRNYRFAFCYENTHSAHGYFTEKIFDGFRAGCVPVYLGPPNTTAHIPPDCFIDRRQFPNHNALFSHLKGISANEFQQYQERIRSYLSSPEARQFTPFHFAEVLQSHILSDLGLSPR
jgi:hypothetical protein